MTSTSTNQHRKRPRLRMLTAAVLTVLTFLGAAQPASADDSVMFYVNSSTSIWTTTNYITPNDEKVTVSYITNWTRHTRSSVKLTTFRICFSTTHDPDHTAVSISPLIYDRTGTWSRDWVFRTFYSGDCRTYTVDHTFRGTNNVSLFQLQGRITHGLIGGSTVVQANR